MVTLPSEAEAVGVNTDKTCLEDSREMAGVDPGTFRAPVCHKVSKDNVERTREHDKSFGKTG